MKVRKIVRILIAEAILILNASIMARAENFNVGDIFEQGRENQKNQANEDVYEEWADDGFDESSLWPGIYYCTYSDATSYMPDCSIELVIEKNETGYYATMYDYRIQYYTLCYDEMYVDGVYMSDAAGANNFTYDMDNYCLYLESSNYYGKLTFWPIWRTDPNFNVNIYRNYGEIDYSGVYYNDASGVIVEINPMYYSGEYYVSIDGNVAIMHPLQKSYEEPCLLRNYLPQMDLIDGFASDGFD